MFITVGGIPGSGKTTITNEIVRIGTSLGLPITRVKGSDIMCKIAGVKNVDQLRSLPEDVRSKIRPKMFEYMYEEDKSDPTTIRVRDMHYSFPDGSGGYVALAPQRGDTDQLLMMVLLNPSPEVLLDRRVSDQVIRDDRNRNLPIIYEELEFEKRTAVSNAEIIGVPLFICENNTSPDQTATLILRDIISLRNVEGQPKNFKENI